MATLEPGVVAGDAYKTLLKACKDQEYALPAVNVVSTHSVNAVLEAAFRGRPGRGRGLMRAVEIGTDALAASRALLQLGFIVLPAGPTSLGFTPPVTLSDAQLLALADALDHVAPRGSS